MTIEQNLKNLLGEYTFQICVLQQQLTTVTAERDALKTKSQEEKKKE